METADDYLLKLRANAATDTTRIIKIFMNRFDRDEGIIAFNDYFEDMVFRNYIYDLNEQDQKEAEKLTYGFVFCTSPNGRIIKTEHGNVIAISESLRYFLYFMNMAFLSFNHLGIDLSGSTKCAAMKIAIRTMLQTETLDFDMDPRGDIPKALDQELKLHVDKQLEFVIGHEFSHHFLKHLNDSNVIDQELYSHPDISPITDKVYSYDQLDEFAADIDALERPEYDNDELSDMVNRALFFFVYLDIYKSVKDQIAPSFGGRKTHPKPIERFNKIFNHFKDKVYIDEENIQNLLKWKDVYKDSLQDDVAVNIESYEFYGSLKFAESFAE